MTRRLAALLPLLLAGCSLAPPYARPTSPSATTWKTADGWQPANPSDDRPRSDWWTAFGDPTLNGLVARIDTANQTLAQAAATYRQAVATTREARASLFPTVSANGSVTHSYSASGRVINGDVISGTGAGTGTGTSTGTGTGSSGTTTATVSSGRSSTNYRINLEASWQPDLFGQTLNTVRNARYTAQARLADLANSRLALQGELVTDYLSLRGADAQIASLVATVQAYQRALQIATNRYNAGIAPHTDVYQAQSQLASAQADVETQRRARAQYEDAIAVLVGENPAGFTLPSIGASWRPTTPDVPVALPATLTERRPDIASAERAVAAANAQIGVEKAAFFPSVTLTGSGGLENDALSGLFSSGATLWSLGAQVAETLLDFGARSARVREARAAYDAAVANYRQVTLTAFQDVQDNLFAQGILARREALLETASTAANRTEASLLEQYKAGTIVFTDVVSAQATALSARSSLIQAQLDRQTAAVALVQALGGGWQAADLANGAEAARAGMP